MQAELISCSSNGRWYWDPSGLRELPKSSKVTQLNAFITMLLEELFSRDRQKITMTICTIDVHARDVVASLVAQKVCIWIGYILQGQF